MHQRTNTILKSVQMFLRYHDFSVFYMAISHHVELLKGKILFMERVWKTEARQHAKFCQNWSIHYGDIADFRIFKMAAVAMLNFRICEILMADGVQRVKTHQHAKFHQHR